MTLDLSSFPEQNTAKTLKITGKARVQPGTFETQSTHRNQLPGKKPNDTETQKPCGFRRNRAESVMPIRAAEIGVEFPNGKRSKPSRVTLWRKWKQYRQGGLDGLMPRRRKDPIYSDVRLQGRFFRVDPQPKRNRPPVLKAQE